MSLSALRYGIRANIALIAAWRDVLSETTASYYCVPTNQSAFAIVCTYWAHPSSDGFVPAVLLLAAAVLSFYAFATAASTG